MMEIFVAPYLAVSAAAVNASVLSAWRKQAGGYGATHLWATGSDAMDVPGIAARRPPGLRQLSSGRSQDDGCDVRLGVKKLRG